MRLQQLLEDKLPLVIGGKFNPNLPLTWPGNFSAIACDLYTLKGAPKKVERGFDCSHNFLRSLEGCPEVIGTWFNCIHNQLTSLERIHKHLKEMDGLFFTSGNQIKSHVLGLFLVKGCKAVKLDNEKVEAIMNKWLPKGRAGLTACQNELIAAGLEEFAQV